MILSYLGRPPPKNQGPPTAASIANAPVSFGFLPKRKKSEDQTINKSAIQQIVTAMPDAQLEKVNSQVDHSHSPQMKAHFAAQDAKKKKVRK